MLEIFESAIVTCIWQGCLAGYIWGDIQDGFEDFINWKSIEFPLLLRTPQNNNKNGCASSSWVWDMFSVFIVWSPWAMGYLVVFKVW